MEFLEQVFFVIFLKVYHLYYSYIQMVLIEYLLIKYIQYNQMK